MQRIFSLAGIAFVVTALCWMSNDDLKQQQLASEHEAESVAAARAEAAREDAHKKAKEMYDKGLFERSNALMYPLAQVTVK